VAIGDAGVGKGERLSPTVREARGERCRWSPYPGRPPTHMGLVAFEASQQSRLASSEGFQHAEVFSET
jgi:hypothetical protein